MRRMSRRRDTRWRRLWRRIPLPVLALALGLTAGVAAWVVIDRQQSDALSEIFKDVLDNQLNQVARESLIRFDQHRRSYIYLARLLANHRRMAAYLQPQLWPEGEVEVKAYHGPARADTRGVQYHR